MGLLLGTKESEPEPSTATKKQCLDKRSKNILDQASASPGACKDFKI